MKTEDIVWIDDDDWDTLEDVEYELSDEWDGFELGEAEIDGELDAVDDWLSIELRDCDRLELAVNDPWFVEVDDFDGLIVILEEDDKDGWDVDVFDTDGEPVIVLDFKEVPLLLGERVDDLDTIGVPVGFTVGVPVFETELEPDTDFVELELAIDVWEALLVVEIELDIDGEDVLELVEHVLIDSDIVCELDPV